MTREVINIFIYENYSKPPKKNYAINETVVYYNDNIWSLHFLGHQDSGPKNKRL